MSITPGADTAPPAAGRLPLWAKLVLFVALPVVFLILLGGIVLGAFALRGTTIAATESVVAGTAIDARLTNAAITVVPSDDDQVTVSVRGSYFGHRPSVDVTSRGGATVITGGCRNGWFGLCRLTVRIEVPARLPVTAAGQNGGIRANGLEGPLELTTRNGSIDAHGTSGPVDLRTVNGSVRVTGAASADVEAITVNGDVDLSFVAPPDRVVAASTNGPVSIELPTTNVRYAIDARTVNGRIDMDGVTNSPGADRVVRASTTNGNVTVSSLDAR